MTTVSSEKQLPAFSVHITEEDLETILKESAKKLLLEKHRTSSFRFLSMESDKYRGYKLIFVSVPEGT